LLATYKANYVEVTAQLIHVDTGYSLRKATEVVSKAFDKITNELIRMNIDSNSGSRIYRFHLNEVDRKIGSFQIKCKTHYVLDCINKLNPLFTVIEKGGKYPKPRLTLVQISPNLYSEITWAVTNSTYAASAIFEGFSEEQFNDSSIFDKIYIDNSSLRNFISSDTSIYKKYFANILLQISYKYGYIPHLISESPYGRKYYKKRYNLQLAHKSIRKASFPNAVEIDINSASNEWLMQQAQLYNLDYQHIKEWV
jgi:hypothetical protein